MEIVDTNLAEIKEFCHTLTVHERSLYDLKWDVMLPSVVYIRGYRDNDKLVGIGGVYRKFFIAYASFHLVKETHWGRGIATKLTFDMLGWMRQHRAPCLIMQHSPNNAGIIRVHEKAGLKAGTRIGDMCYNVEPSHGYFLPVKYLLLTLIQIRVGLQKLRIWSRSVKFRRIRLGYRLLRIAAFFIDYGAAHLPISGRVVEYGFVQGKLMTIPKGRALDVGCVALYNYTSPSLAFAGWDVYGIDIRGDWGFTHPNFHFVQRDIKESGFESEYFDILFCISTLEHIGIAGQYGVSQEDTNGDIRAASEMTRITKQGGRLLLTVPYHNTYFVRRGARVYDLKRLKEMFEGFDIVDKQIYIWRGNAWLETKGNLEKEGIICLELVKK